MSSDDSSIWLVQDSREQNGWRSLFSRPCIVDTLPLGDYSVAGLEEHIAVERKSLQDLLGSLTQGRERFEAELKKARTLHRFYVIVEAPWEALLVPDFGKLSQATPVSIWGTAMAWSTRYATFLFAGERRIAAKLCEGLLVGYAQHLQRLDKDLRRGSKRAERTQR